MPEDIAPARAAPVIKTVDIAFDDLGYIGWTATMRLNVKAREFDDFRSNDTETFWKGMQAIVRAWTFVDDDGKPLPLPSEGLEWKDLPYEVINALTSRYIVAFGVKTEVPKETAGNSGDSSLTEANPSAPEPA